MKSIYKYFVPILAAVVLTTSCEDYLEEKNVSGLTADEYYATTDGIEALVNSCYTTMRFWYGKEDGMALTETGTDIFTRGSGMENPSVALYNSELNGTSRPALFYWNRLYSGLNTCNAAIGRLDASPLSDDLKTIRLAEARFLRAFYLWHIVETWGGVHLSTEEVKDIQQTANRTPVEEFYNVIFEDLLFAVNNLPPTSADYGRVTKPAAEGFLARMYLTRGQNALAAQYAKNVINNYNFAMLDDYNRLWGANPSKSSEVVFAVNFTTNLVLDHEMDGPSGNDLTIRGGGNNSHLFFLMTYDQLPGMKRDIALGRPFSRFMPTAHLLDLYNEDTDARYDATFQSVYYCNNLSNAPAGMTLGDTAIYATKRIIPAAEQAQHNYTTIDRRRTYDVNDRPIVRDRYVSLKKFLDPTRQNLSQTPGLRDFYVIRLAEMYLIVAEAERATNPTEATQYFNMVRERAAKPGREAEMRVAPADLTLDLILDERAREFAGEQLRWFDLKRTNKLIEKVRLWNTDAAGNIQDYHMVRPIPQSQLDAITNPAEFFQNEGYR
jgi:hypothetical protein